MEVDHYSVLGLPSEEEGANLTAKEITKAYREKALDLHPDKRKDDPNAHENFIKLKSSYEILVDEKARKLFDDLLRVKRDQQRRFAQQDSKRRKMMSDLEDRERASFAVAKAREEEERIARKLKEEIASIRAMHANKVAGMEKSQKLFNDFLRMKRDQQRGAMHAYKGGSGLKISWLKIGQDYTAGRGMGAGSGSGLHQEKVGREANNGAGVGLDKEKVLKVSWLKIGEDYTVDKLRELFSRFGKVEDIVITSSKNKKKGYALVDMSTKEAAIAATRGSVSGLLLVVPLKPATVAPQKAEETDRVGAGACEDSV